MGVTKIRHFYWTKTKRLATIRCRGLRVHSQRSWQQKMRKLPSRLTKRRSMGPRTCELLLKTATKDHSLQQQTSLSQTSRAAVNRRLLRVLSNIPTKSHSRYTNLTCRTSWVRHTLRLIVMSQLWHKSWRTLVWRSSHNGARSHSWSMRMTVSGNRSISSRRN